MCTTPYVKKGTVFCGAEDYTFEYLKEIHGSVENVREPDLWDTHISA